MPKENEEEIVQTGQSQSVDPQDPVDEIKISIISPVQAVAEETAQKVLLPGEKGAIMLLLNRAPLFIALRAGRMVLYKKGGETETYFVSRGVAELRSNRCSVLAWAVKEKDVKLDGLKEKLREGEEAFSMAHLPLAKKESLVRLEFIKMMADELLKNTQLSSEPLPIVEEVYQPSEEVSAS